MAAAPRPSSYAPILRQHIAGMREALNRLKNATEALDRAAAVPLKDPPEEALDESGALAVSGAMVVAACPEPSPKELAVWDHTPVLNHPPVFLDLVEGGCLDGSLSLTVHPAREPSPQNPTPAASGIVVVCDRGKCVHNRVILETVCEFHRSYIHSAWIAEFGADPSGQRDSGPALAHAITAAHRYSPHCTIRIPTGRYLIGLVADDHGFRSDDRPSPPITTPMELRGDGPRLTVLEFVGPRRVDRFPLWLGTSHLTIAALRVELSQQNFPRRSTASAAGLTLNLDAPRTEGLSDGESQEVRVRRDVRLCDVVVAGFDLRGWDIAPRAPAALGPGERCCAAKCTPCDVVAHRERGELLVASFELWLQADAVVALPTGPHATAAAMYLEAADGVAQEPECSALLLGNAAEMLLRAGDVDAARLVAARAVCAAEAAHDNRSLRENKTRLAWAQLPPDERGSLESRTPIMTSSAYFGTMRNCSPVAGAAGSVRGLAAELEAAHKLAIGREAWSHTTDKTPFEAGFGDCIGFLSPLPKAANAKSDEKRSQEIDLVVGNLWAEVKDSDYSETRSSSSLQQQLERYRLSAAEWVATSHARVPPEFAAVFTQPVGRHLRKELSDEGCRCIQLEDPGDLMAVARPHPPNVVRECVPLAPRSEPGPLVLDEQVIGLLVADIWDLTAGHMAEAGIDSITLLSSDLCVTTPEAFLKFLRPLRDIIVGAAERDIHVARAVVEPFERFLRLRGNPTEVARWETAVSTRCIFIHEHVEVPQWLEMLCCSQLNLTQTSATTVALAIQLDGTAIVDSDALYELLRHRTDIKIIRGLSCKFRNSYLKVPVAGRKTELDCSGPCRRRRIPASCFGYTDRRAGQRDQAAVCISCKIGLDVIDVILTAYFDKQARTMSRWVRMSRAIVRADRRACGAAVLNLSTKHRLGILRTIVTKKEPKLPNSRGLPRESQDFPLWVAELQGWLADAETAGFKRKLTAPSMSVVEESDDVDNDTELDLWLFDDT